MLVRKLGPVDQFEADSGLLTLRELRKRKIAAGTVSLVDESKPLIFIGVHYQLVLSVGTLTCGGGLNPGDGGWEISIAYYPREELINHLGRLALERSGMREGFPAEGLVPDDAGVLLDAFVSGRDPVEIGGDCFFYNRGPDGFLAGAWMSEGEFSVSMGQVIVHKKLFLSAVPGK